MHPDLITVAEAAKLAPPGRASKTGHRSASSIYRMLKDKRLTNMGPLGGPQMVSVTELRHKLITPCPQQYRGGRWVARG